MGDETSYVTLIGLAGLSRNEDGRECVEALAAREVEKTLQELRAKWLCAHRASIRGQASVTPEELMARLAKEDDEFCYDGTLDVAVRGNGA